MPSPRPIRFVHRGAVVEVDRLPPTTSVLAWLREHAGRCGSKEGCNEGDCGACTVIVAEPADAAAAVGAADAIGTDAARAGVVQGLRLRTVNACLQPLPTLDGKALFTVEDLPASPGQALHPAQQAMLDCHGSQCGFCTPGFVMSLAACDALHRARGTRPTRRTLADALAGNLCRCTGYRPILDAGQRMADLPAAAWDLAPVAQALARLQDDPPLHYAAQQPATGAPETWDAPRSVDALATLLEARPDVRLIAGATDVGLWIHKQLRDLPALVSTTAVRALRRVEAQEVDGRPQLRIGAAVPLEDAWQALAAAVPALDEVWRRFAGPPVRHAGTLGGNLANGSPIGDGAPVLMALGAALALRRGDRRRRVALDDFYLGYMANRLEAGEFVEAIEVPLPAPATVVRAWKLGKRHDCDISTLCAGFALSLDGGTVAEVRLAYGGMAAVVQRAAQAEAALRGRPWTEASVQAAMAALAADFEPLSDHRGSAAYRRRAAAALLWRLWLQTRPVDPLPPAATEVWASMASADPVAAA
jgi:xanthine dehydrogenase small subunit